MIMNALQRWIRFDAAHILAATADIVLVINSDGIISERVITGPDLQSNLFIGWPGKAWSDVVTIESLAQRSSKSCRTWHWIYRRVDASSIIPFPTAPIFPCAIWR